MADYDAGCYYDTWAKDSTSFCCGYLGAPLRECSVEACPLKSKTKSPIEVLCERVLDKGLIISVDFDLNGQLYTNIRCPHCLISEGHRIKHEGNWRDQVKGNFKHSPWCSTHIAKNTLDEIRGEGAYK